MTSKTKGILEKDWPSLTAIELKRAITSTKDKSTPSNDKLSYKVLKEAYKLYLDLFFNVYSALFNKGYYSKI